MYNIIGVKFRNISRVYYFDPKDLPVRYHDHVIVETARGIEYGTVVMSPTEVPDEKVVQPLREVLRLATDDDDARVKANKEKEHEAYRICKEKIREHKLDMKLIEAEYAFDNSKILFYFTADGRIDFRELVKDLAGVFRTRIELRQIGVRDETKILGGIGICGRPLCCHTYLSEFAPVSIKMAKEQNLSLNPTKISGTCGRLMCCLKNEADTYACLSKNLPSRGDYVTTPEGDHGEVQSVDILRQRVRVVVELDHDEKELRDYDVSDITFISKKKRAAQLRAEKAQEPENKNKPAGREKTEDRTRPGHAGDREARERGAKNPARAPRRDRRDDRKEERKGAVSAELAEKTVIAASDGDREVSVTEIREASVTLTREEEAAKKPRRRRRRSRSRRAGGGQGAASGNESQSPDGGKEPADRSLPDAGQKAQIPQIPDSRREAAPQRAEVKGAEPTEAKES